MSEEKIFNTSQPEEQARHIDPKLIKTCPICSDKTDGNHFGIDSCRACAAFFRRSIVGAKKYNCRHGRGSCEVNKAIKSMCRRCRLTKCLISGMNPECVRDPFAFKPNPLLPSTSRVPVAFKEISPVEVAQSVDKIDPELFTKIFKEYKQLCSIRRATELALSGGSVSRVFSSGSLFSVWEQEGQSTRFQGLVEGNFKYTSLFYRAHIPAMGDFVSNIFPEFNEFTQDEKWVVFRPFVVQSWIMDNQYRTTKRIPAELHTRYHCISETSYIDMENIEEFWENGKEMSKQEMAKMLPKIMVPALAFIAKPMLDMEIEDEEYAFLLALVLWGNDCDRSNEKIESLCTRMREKCYSSLEAYYRKMGRMNTVARVGALHNIHCGVIQHVYMMREYNELFYLVDAYDSDSFIHEFLKT